MKKLQFAIVGCGYWGPNFARILNESDKGELVYVCDLDEKNLSGISSQKYTTKYTDIIADKSIDAVIICTPVHSHFAISRDFLLAGKHVLCEKPLCETIEQAGELKNIAIERQCILMVGHLFEFNSIVQKLKDLVTQSSFGNLLYINMQRNGLGPVRKDVNVFYDLGAHDISIALYLMDKMPVAVIAQGSSFIDAKNIDIGFITLYFANQILIQINNSWLDAIKEREIKIVGTKQTLLFDDISSTAKLKIFQTGISYQKNKGDFGSFQLNLRDGDMYIPLIDYPEPLKEEVSHFINCILFNKKPSTDAENAIRVVKILQAVQKSLQQNGQKIFIDA